MPQYKVPSVGELKGMAVLDSEGQPSTDDKGNALNVFDEIQRLTGGVPRQVHRMIGGIFVKELQLTPATCKATLLALAEAVADTFDADLVTLSADLLQPYLQLMLRARLGKALIAAPAVSDTVAFGQDEDQRLFNLGGALPVMFNDLGRMSAKAHKVRGHSRAHVHDGHVRRRAPPICQLRSHAHDAPAV